MYPSGGSSFKAIFFLIIILVGLGFFLSQTFNQTSNDLSNLETSLRQLSDQQLQLNALKTQVNQMQAVIEAQKQEIAALQTPIKANTDSSTVDELVVRANLLEYKVNNLQTQLDQTNVTIQNDPNRALTVPLLKKDMENFTNLFNTRLNDMQNSINLTIQLVIGIPVALLITYIVGIFFTKEKAVAPSVEKK